MSYIHYYYQCSVTETN